MLLLSAPKFRYGCFSWDLLQAVSKTAPWIIYREADLDILFHYFPLTTKQLSNPRVYTVFRGNVLQYIAGNMRAQRWVILQS
jgi:hypothetical protein